MTAAVGWGVLAASSLVIGALLGLLRPWPPRLIGLVLAFGAGALISAVSFDLAQEGARVGSAGVTGAGLAVGAITYFSLNRVVGRRSRGASGQNEDAGSALALGAFLDGIPEQTVLGIGIADSCTFLSEIKADGADQRAGSEREDEPDEPRRPRSGQSEQRADHQRRRGKRAPPQGRGHADDPLCRRRSRMTAGTVPAQPVAGGWQTEGLNTSSRGSCASRFAVR